MKNFSMIWEKIKFYLEEIQGCYQSGKFWYCVKAFLQGTIRYFMYRTLLKVFLTSYVVIAYEERVEQAKPCYMNGRCLHCGCETPALFFADRGCSKEEEPCYESMIPLWKRILNKLTKK